MTIENFNIESLLEKDINLTFEEKILFFAVKHYMITSHRTPIEVAYEMYDLSSQVSDCFSAQSKHLASEYDKLRLQVR